ncbi:MAG: ATP-binding protein [Bacteroidales bacterium]|nr:transcriptional regulator [Bacteroidales bacterium]
MIFIKETDNRHSKETAFIRKAEKEVVRQSFGSYDELQTAVYASLIDYLSDKEYIRRLPFDATLAFNATIDDIDSEKIRKFVHSAGVRRGFPFGEDVEPFELLTHLNLCQGERITNAALLLFGKKPQYFFSTSTVKCGQFYGIRKEKPIPSYHIYSGDVFEVIDQAVSFVLSRIDARVGTRDKGASVDVDLELPIRAVTEAIVNAVCHRDYTSNGSVEVMLYKDRLEVWNPGHLPFGWTTKKLFSAHNSIPANPLIATPMYLAGTIEQAGTGTEEIVKKCLAYGLRQPEFIQEDGFTTVVWRKEASGVKEVMEDGGLNGGLNDTQKRVLEYISENGGAKVKDMSDILSIPVDTLDKVVSFLVKKLFIERRGSKKTGGYWLVR